MSLFGNNTHPEQNDDDEYYVIPVIPVDDLIHTPDHLFCDDPDCLCKEDEENREKLQEWYDEGLIGPVDGDLIYRGKTI